LKEWSRFHTRKVKSQDTGALPTVLIKARVRGVYFESKV